MTFRRVGILAVLGLLLQGPTCSGPEAEHLSLLRVELRLEGSTRISRTSFRYDYSVDVENAGTNDLADLTVAFSSDDPATAVVDPTAFARFVPAGQITATSDTVSIIQDRTQPFDPTALVPSFSCPPPELSVIPTALRTSEIGGSLPITAHLLEECLRQDVAASSLFTSSDPGVASVSASGQLTFVGAGLATILVENAAGAASLDVEVGAGLLERAAGTLPLFGGELSLPDGTGVAVPGGALAAPTVISIEEELVAPDSVPEEGLAVGRAYRFAPDGLTFDEPVEITMRYSPAAIPPGGEAEHVAIHRLEGNGLFLIETPSEDLADLFGAEDLLQGVDALQETVTVTTSGFSCRVPLLLAPFVSEAILVAPDATQLRVLQRFRPPPPAFPLPPTRNVADIDTIVLHSTEGVNNPAFVNSVRAISKVQSAHYVVGKDGTIVQTAADGVRAGHVRPNPLRGIDNGNSIGIEIYHNQGDVEYPGAQISAVVRLLDFLLRKYAGQIDRPSPSNPRGGITTHDRQDAETPFALMKGSCAERKSDPTGPFLSEKLSDPVVGCSAKAGTCCTQYPAVQFTPVMLDPSIEGVVYRALFEEHGGIIVSKGGDAVGTDFVPGAGGDVTIVSGDVTLENPLDRARTTRQVAAGELLDLPPSEDPHDFVSLLIDGEPGRPAVLRVSQDATLDIDGVFYVGPNGRVEARGDRDGGAGHSIDAFVDGFVFIEGEVRLDGSDKLQVDEFPPFVPGTGWGSGGDGGHLTVMTFAPGPIWVPSIVSRGGDAETTVNEVGGGMPGGRGGDVTIEAKLNDVSDRTDVFLGGHYGVTEIDALGVPVPFNFAIDYLPPTQFDIGVVPLPFGAGALRSGDCVVGAFSFLPDVFIRGFGLTTMLETYWERTPLGTTLRFDAVGNVEPGVNISRVERGIVTVGGRGADFAGGPGGDAGNISALNRTQGFLRFEPVFSLAAGAGLERVAQIRSHNGSYVCPTGTTGSYVFEESVSGGLGGYGVENGARGGLGGDITIEGWLEGQLPGPPPVVGLPPSVSGFIPVVGKDGGDPLVDFGENNTLGQILEFPQGFQTNSIGGEGGWGRGLLAPPGENGAQGDSGRTEINRALY